MEKLVEEFNSSLKTPHFDRGDSDQGIVKTNFEGLYKNWGKLGNQEERRREILEVQKCNRNNNLDTYRGILHLVQSVEERELFGPNRRVHYRPSIYVAGFHKVSSSYNNVLMMSEWLVEKPSDLHDNWLVVPCPKGVRMIVVASQGITKCYTKYGHFRFQMRTAFPGGNPCEPKRRERCTVLDCFYYEPTNTMYILDILAWWTQPMTDGDTEFRHFWLESKLDELPELKKISKKNEMIFKLLPKTSCTPEGLSKVMQTYPMFEGDVPSLDGLLFYHKRVHYVSGETPLVGWLFPYMVPEVLGEDIAINNFYMLQKPVDYVSQADFIQKFEAKMAKKNPRNRRSKSNAMDTTDESQSNDDGDRTREATAIDMTEGSSADTSKENASKMESEQTEKVVSNISKENEENESKIIPDKMDAQNGEG